MDRVTEVDLQEIFRACLQKIWLILLGVLVLGVAAYMYTVFFITPLYRAETSFYVNNSQQADDSQKISSADLATAQRLVMTYVNVIKSDTVLEKVISQSGLKLTPAEARGMMTAEPMDETEIFVVRISHPDPYMAARIANSIADAAPIAMADILVGSTMKIVDRAKVPTAPYTPNVAQNTLLGALIGAVLAVLYVVIRTLFDVRIKGEKDLAAFSSVPVLGVIPDFSVERKSGYGAAKTNKAGRR